MKTNKSYTKRIKVSKNGKIRARKAGQNHFNAKERRRRQMNKRRPLAIHMNQGAISRFLTGAKN